MIMMMKHRIINSIVDTSSLGSDIEKLAAELDAIRNQIFQFTNENGNDHEEYNDRGEYTERRDAMLDEHDTIINKINEIEDNKRERIAKRESITRFLSEIEHSAGFLTEFDEDLWRSVAESMTVYGESDFAVKFRDGSEVRVSGPDM